jgi:peroxiredoxin
MLLYNNLNNLNHPVIDFKLKSVDGKYYSVDSFKSKDILVIIFMCNHCPYVIAVIKRLVKLQKYFENKSVQFVGINPNDVEAYPEDSFDNMIIFHKENKMNFPYLIDETQEVAKKYDSVCTPDIYVYDKERILRYRGRIDDNWQNEDKVSREELKEALEQLVEGKLPSESQFPSMGCSIKWK